MRVGSIVILLVPVLDNKKFTIGVCYETYGSNGASFIFENGEYDGFSLQEQHEFLHEVDYSEILQGYRFKSVLQLNTDWNSGVFDSALECSDELRNSYISKMRENKIDSITN